VKIGFFGVNTGIYSDPECSARIACAAEEAGYESVFSCEHVVIIDPREAPSPLPPHSRQLDQAVTLAFMAAHTQRLRLGTGIVILPQRNPVILAKALASLDVLSAGRLLVGVGVGYVQGEFDAIGVPFEERGPRTSEHIEAMRALWTQDSPSFEGRFSNFSGIQSLPQPVQDPHPPILVGGLSKPALRRAVQQGNGWFGFNTDLESTAAAVRGLEAAAQEVERPASLGPLELSVTPPPGPVDLDLQRAYEDLGIERIVVMRSARDMVGQPDAKGEKLADALDFLHRNAEALQLG